MNSDGLKARDVLIVSFRAMKAIVVAPPACRVDRAIHFEVVPAMLMEARGSACRVGPVDFFLCSNG